MDNQKGLIPTHIQSDIIYIEEDSNSTLSLSKKSCRSKKYHEKQNRKVKVEKNNNRETLIISQKVKVKKQKIQCIINLSNIYKYEEAWRSKNCLKKVSNNSKTSLKTHTKSPKICLKEQATPKSSPKVKGYCVEPKKSPKVDLSSKVERIVPHCLRTRCQAAISSKHQQIAKERSKNRKHRKHHAENKRHGTDVSEGYLSPISVSSFHPSPELEDISSDSFTVCQEDRLDTLIKRTKDRERRLSKRFEFKPPSRTSTPKHVEASDTETLHIRSEGDTSINSVSTFILDPQQNADLDLYSPTYPTKSPEIAENIFETFKCFKSLKYSPAIDSHIYEGNAKTECNEALVKMEDEQNCSMNFSNPIKSYDTDNKSSLKRNEEHKTEIGVIEKDLHAYRTPFVIKQENNKTSPLRKDYSPNITNLWINNNNFDYQQKSDTKGFSYEHFNKYPSVMPNIKVENTIDFTTFTENNINLRIKTEVNVKHEH